MRLRNSSTLRGNTYRSLAVGSPSPEYTRAYCVRLVRRENIPARPASDWSAWLPRSASSSPRVALSFGLFRVAALAPRPKTSKSESRIRYILTADQSDAGSAGIFSQRTNHNTHGTALYIRRKVRTWVYSHGGPIRRRKRRYILTTDQSDLSPHPAVVLAPLHLLQAGLEGLDQRLGADQLRLHRHRLRLLQVQQDPAPRNGAPLVTNDRSVVRIYLRFLLWGVECTLAVIGTGGP
eukprot:1185809-Prorocentrum_minimum.AAC.2